MTTEPEFTLRHSAPDRPAISYPTFAPPDPKIFRRPSMPPDQVIFTLHSRDGKVARLVWVTIPSTIRELAAARLACLEKATRTTGVKGCKIPDIEWFQRACETFDCGPKVRALAAACSVENGPQYYAYYEGPKLGMDFLPGDCILSQAKWLVEVDCNT